MARSVERDRAIGAFELSGAYGLTSVISVVSRAVRGEIGRDAEFHHVVGEIPSRRLADLEHSRLTLRAVRGHLLEFQFKFCLGLVFRVDAAVGLPGVLVGVFDEVLDILRDFVERDQVRAGNGLDEGDILAGHFDSPSFRVWVARLFRATHRVNA